jgi:CRISPR system Cascade subunit CasA
MVVIPSDQFQPSYEVRCVLNLLTAPWIPVRRLNSGPDIISPSGLLDHLTEDPVIAIDWPRADFRIATFEFLIGLLATSCPPEDGNDWLDWWESPPDSATLAVKLAPYAHAFNLDGDGPRFLQDIEDLDSAAKPIERLLIESPGTSTIERNTDLLVHRGRVEAMGRPAAAIALYTLQSWAPEGGSGIYTGLRGGGPLSTFVLPGARRTLWHMLWANVPYGEPPDTADLKRVFPWLVPTITANNGRVVMPDGAHPLQAWWGMPRRIRLDFNECELAVACGVTGVRDPISVTSWRQLRHGANYKLWGDVHQLTPRYRVKPTSEVLPLHPQPGGIGYRHWVGLVVSDVAGLRWPAPSVSTWRGERAGDVRRDHQDARHDRILAAGYDMKKANARGFVESEMPLPAIPDAEVRKRVDDLARQLVLAADVVAGLLRKAVRDALFSAGAKVELKWEMLSAVREQLWDGTEAAFHAALAREIRRDASAPGSEPLAWLETLRPLALDLFDAAAPLAADGGSMPKSDDGIRRLLRARRNLGLALLGYGKDGGALFHALELPPVETKPAKTKPPAKGRVR